MRAREAVMQRFRPHLRRHGLTDQQWRIIRVLAERGAVEMLALSAECCIHPASLSRIIPRLDAKGIVQRRSDAADQRRISVSLTARGRRMFDDMAEESEAIYEALTAELGVAETQAIYAMLDSVIRLLANGAATPADED